MKKYAYTFVISRMVIWYRRFEKKYGVPTDKEQRQALYRFLGGHPENASIRCWSEWCHYRIENF